MLPCCFLACIFFLKYLQSQYPVPLDTTCSLPLVTFKVFYLSLVVSNLIMMYLGVGFFMFLMLGIYWDSWIHRFLVFIKFGIFSANIKIFFLSCLFPLITWLQLCIYEATLSYSTDSYSLKIVWASFWIVSVIKESILMFFKVYWCFLLQCLIWN